MPKGTKEIISCGGGSTIDVGKWLAYKYKLHHTAIPTTAGTGSEVTRYCVLTVKGKKKTFNLEKPDSYILEPEKVVSLPRLHTIASGLDALSQALESLWSKNAMTESRLYSATAMELVFQNLSKCVKKPKDKIARMNMLLAANLSGRAIEITKTNVCHAVSYPLTDIYRIPHGIACALTLPYFTKKILGLDIYPFIKQFKLPKYKIDKNRVVDEVINNPKLKDCPLVITKKMLDKAFCDII